MIDIILYWMKQTKQSLLDKGNKKTEAGYFC